MMTELTPEDRDCLKRLRNNGCAVTVFLPEEIGEADAGDVEDRMCGAGWDEINDANPGRITV